jgi:citrate synthase
VIDQIGDNRIIRPLSVYSGAAARDYLPLATRG